MASESSASYEVVVDKGTLDAIASGGAEDKVCFFFTATCQHCAKQSQTGSDPQLGDASLYMREMWRVLCIGGLFVVVTTMPPDILQTIAIDPIAGGGGSAAVNWGAGHVHHKLQTPEGGDIHYYALKKLGEVPTVQSKAGSSSGGSAGLGLGSARKEDVMGGIMALLEEAKKAAAAVQEATSKVSITCCFDYMCVFCTDWCVSASGGGD